jgi:excisionase family DNA binding protein
VETPGGFFTNRGECIVTVREAAEALEISQALVYALVARGKIRHERHGLRRGTIRIPPEALEEYRKTRTVGAEEPQAPPPPRHRLKLRHLEA